MRIQGAGYVGDFNPGRTVLAPFRTCDSTGAQAEWLGLVYCVRPDGSQTEAGVSVAFGQPVKEPGGDHAAVGNHLVTVDTAADPAFYARDLDYRLIAYGDPLDGVPVQGVVVGQFSIANRS